MFCSGNDESFPTLLASGSAQRELYKEVCRMASFFHPVSLLSMWHVSEWGQQRKELAHHCDACHWTGLLLDKCSQGFFSSPFSVLCSFSFYGTWVWIFVSSLIQHPTPSIIRHSLCDWIRSEADLLFSDSIGSLQAFVLFVICKRVFETCAIPSTFCQNWLVNGHSLNLGQLIGRYNTIL